MKLIHNICHDNGTHGHCRKLLLDLLFAMKKTDSGLIYMYNDYNQTYVKNIKLT